MQALGNAELFILLTRPDLYTMNDTGTYFTGITRFGSFGKYLNYLLPRYSFKEVWRTLEATTNIVHYITPSLFPVVSNENSVVTIHDNPFALLSDLYIQSRARIRSIKGYLMKYAEFEHILTVSKYVKRKLIEYGFEGSIEVANPPVRRFHKLGIDKARLRTRMGLPQDKLLILSVSTIQKRKNTSMIPSVMENLGDDFQLVRVGEKLGKSITFSNVSDNVLNTIYNACDVLFFPSIEEGYGYPVLEAFSTGLPVVASRIEVLEEISGNASILCDNEKVSFVRGIRDAISNSSILSEQGLRRSKLYKYEGFKRKIVEFYSKI